MQSTATTEKPKKTKKLARTVRLDFFQDEATGEYGFATAGTLEACRYGNHDGFNAFWDGYGCFHEVFEHNHEHSRYFRGDAAMNIGGEMAAMGAMWYYIECVGVSSRLRPSYLYSYSDSFKATTFDLISEAIKSGYCNYGRTLVSNVPNQKPIEEDCIESILNDYVDAAEKLAPDSDNDSVDFSVEYKQSVTGDKIRNLHRWGYREAEKLVAPSYYNAGVLNDFIRFWNDFCKKNNAEELAGYYKSIVFRFYTGRDGDLSWKAQFVPLPDIAAHNRNANKNDRIYLELKTIYSDDI